MSLVANRIHGESDTGVRMSTGTELSELSERQLFALRRRLASGVHDPALTLRGALHHDLRRCSSENCRCRSGELHGPYAYLTVYGDGRSRTVYLPRGRLAQVDDRLARECRRNRVSVAERTSHAYENS